MKSCFSLGAFALAALAAGSAHAILNGINPDTTPVVNAMTGQASILSRLGGSVSGVSAVQIAPRWILASRHAAPGAGAVFTNKYGSATVATGCVFPTETYAKTGPDDVALCRLAGAIALPAGAAFPALTGLPASGPEVSHWGLVEAVGFSGGLRRVAWSGLDGLPFGFDVYSYQLSPNTTSFDATTVLPYTADGDSGGGVFFYPDDGNTGYIAGVLTGEALVGRSPTYLSPAHAQWVRTTILGQGDVAPAYVDFSQIVGDTSTRVPRSMSGSTVAAQVTGHTSATLSWTPPTSSEPGAGAITRYMTRFISPDTASGVVKLAGLSGSTSVNTLVDGKRYQACVMSGNAVGYRQSFNLTKPTPDTRLLTRLGCTWFTAGTPNAPLANGDYQLVLNAAGKVDLAGNWAPPAANGVTIGAYVVTVKVWASWGNALNTPAIRTTTIQTPALSFQLPNVISGKEAACWSVAARSVSQVPGPDSQMMCFRVSSVGAN